MAALIRDLRNFLSNCDNPHASVLSGRDDPRPAGKDSARELESLVIEQYEKQLSSKRDVADWLRLVFDVQKLLAQEGIALAPTRLAALPLARPSPFNPIAMRASQQVDAWRSALGQWLLKNSSSALRDEWLTGVAISAVLFGGLLDTAKVKLLVESLHQGPVLQQASGFAYLEFDMPLNGLGNHHLQRWFFDPVTELLVLRMPEQETGAPVKNIGFRIKKFLKEIGVDKAMCPFGIADFISSATTWWACRAAQIDLNAIRRTFYAHSINPRSWERFHGLTREDKRAIDGKTRLQGFDENSLLDDVMLLYLWLAESFDALMEDSLEAARTSAEAQLEKEAEGSLGKVYLGWLVSMLSGSSATKNALSLSTIRRRYMTAAPRLLGVLGNADPRKVKVGDLEDHYSELSIEVELGVSPVDLVKGIIEFHAHLVKTHGVKPIRKPREVFGDEASFLPVDANLVSYDDYLAAQKWLDARLVEGRELDDITICKLVLAIAFRLGMRRMEILNLRLQDVQVVRGMVCLVRKYDGHRLKTSNSQRTIPIDAFFNWQERKLLKAWHARRCAEEGRTSLPEGSVRSSLLFARVDGRHASRQVSVDGVTDRVCEALRAVTGDTYIFLHHLRHAFGTWTYLRLRAPNYPILTEFFDGLPETEKAIRHGRRLRRQLSLDDEDPSRPYAFAVARLLGHSSPAVSMAHYIHSNDLILAAIAHRQISEVPRSVLVAASGLPAPTAYRHLEKSAHQLVLATRSRHPSNVNAGYSIDASKTQEAPKRGRPFKPPAHTHPRWTSLTKVWSVLDLSAGIHLSAGSIAIQLGLSVERVESILAKAREFGACIDLTPGTAGEVACPARLRCGNEVALAQELEEKLASLASKSPGRYLEGLELHLRHFNRKKRDVVFRGEKDAAELRCYLKFLKRLGLSPDRFQWVVRKPPGSASELPAWVSKVGASWKPAKVKLIAPQSRKKAQSYSQWVGLQALDKDGRGLGQAMAAVLFLARVAAES
jgi:integrase